MEYELVIVSIITGIFTLIGLTMININWVKRQEIKYRYQIKKAKLSKKLKEPIKEETTLTSTVGSLLPLLKNLDPDQISDLIDWVTGQGYEVGEGSGIEGLLGNIPPELIKGFIEGLNKNKKSGFSGQDM